MGTITRQYTYADGETINPDENNANEIALYNLVNGELDGDNLKASAAIAESKIAFNTSTGHSHNGTDSKLIPATAVFTVVGTQTVSTDPTNWIYLKDARTVTAVAGILKTAPTGADFIIDIEVSSDNGDTWTSIWNTTPANRLTISAGNREGTQTSFDTTTLSAGDYVRIANDQIGSTVAGEDLQVFLTI